jgi:hypothetical protein
MLKDYASAPSLTARTRRLLENYLTLDSRSSSDSVANRIGRRPALHRGRYARSRPALCPPRNATAMASAPQASCV